MPPTAPKLDDQRVLDSLLASHPYFEGVTNWEAGPNPPDFIGTRQNGEKIGLELTEWLDGEQTTKSITRMDAQYRWLEALRTESEPTPSSFDRVTLNFKESVQFNEPHVPTFRQEFLQIIRGADVSGSSVPHVIFNFSGYPTLNRYLADLSFERLPEKYRPAAGTRWVGTGGRFYLTDPQKALRTLLETIQNKIRKTNYAGLTAGLGLQELILLVHFGIKGLLHHVGPSVATAPIAPLLAEVRSRLNAAGPFSKIYLYLALNEGPLHVIFS